MMRPLFGSTVPNTYAAGVASLRVGWGGLRRDTFVGQEQLVGKTASCECGLLKRKGAEACFRCASLELPIDGAKRSVEARELTILDALRDLEWMTVYEIAGLLGCSSRTVWRYIGTLVKSGRVETKYEELDDAPTAAYRPPTILTLFRRVW